MEEAEALQASARARPPWWTWLLLVVVGLAVLLPGTGQMPLLDRDEPRFSQATVEMIERDTWVVPYFNGEYRFDKPPLTYWWMRLNYAVLGQGELGARMHSVLSAVGVALLLLAMGRHFFGWRVHFWAAMAWLTIVQVWIHGRLALADMPMILCLVLVHWALWRLLCGEAARRWGVWFWALWLGMALGFLAKGPLILFSAALTLLLFRLAFWREPLPWGRLQALPGLLLCVLIVALWGLPALEQTGGLFWQVGIGTHVVDRGLGAFNDRVPIPVVYYVATAFISLFPWLGRLGAGWRALRDNWDRETAFLLAWALGPQLIFAFYATQLPHYVLPGFPALMLLLLRRPKLDTRFARGFYKGYHGVFLALLFTMALWLSFGPVFPPVKPFLLGAVAVLLGLQFIAMSWERRRTWGIAMGVAMASIGSGLTGAGLQRVALSPMVAPLAADAKGTVAAVGYTEPSLVFYSGRQWQLYPGSPRGLMDAMDGGPALLVVLRQSANLNDMLGFDRQPATVTEAARLAESRLTRGWIRFTAEGLNIGSSKWVVVDVYRRIQGVDEGRTTVVQAE